MPAEPRLFPDELEHIREALLAGQTYRQIAVRLDRDRSTVFRNAVAMGLRSLNKGGHPTRENAARSLTEAERSVVRQMTEAGASFHAIGRHLGVDAKAISTCAKRLGIKPNFRFGGNRQP